MSAEYIKHFRKDFAAYLEGVLDDVNNVQGTDEEMRSELIEIAQDVIETLETRLQAEDKEE